MTEQLKRAAALIKQGEKGQASQVLRSILREDPQNVEAWWMLSYTFDSPEKAQQALERALSLDPSHAASNKRMATLQGKPAPAVAPAAVPAQAAAPAPRKAQTQGDEYWNKLENPAKPKGGMARDVLGSLLSNGWTLRIVVMIIVVAGGGIFTLFQNINVRDANGQTPTDVARAFEEAFWVEDAATMRSLLCPGFNRYFDEMWVNTYTYSLGYNPVTDVSFARMRTQQIRFTGDEASVAFHGEVSWTAEGERLTFNYDDEIEAQGGEVWIGHHVKLIDGVWMICDGPETVWY